MMILIVTLLLMFLLSTYIVRAKTADVAQEGYDFVKCMDKNFNYNGTICQLLQDDTYFGKSLSVYQQEVNSLPISISSSECYAKCMNGEMGLPSCDILCNKSCGNKNK